MPRPVCVKCEIEMRWSETGATVIEMAVATNGPYKIWNSDVAKCPMCGNETVIRYANGPHGVSGEDSFDAKVKRLKDAVGDGSKKRIIYNHEVIGGKKATEGM